MQIDRTTLGDLGVFHKDEEYSLFHLINFTKTAEGKSVLQQFLSSPFSQLDQILEVQLILKQYENQIDNWTGRITNGTVMVIEKFLDDHPDRIPEVANWFNTTLYRWLHAGDYAMIKFSMKQVFEFIKGFEEIHQFFSGAALPARLKDILLQSERMLSDRHLKILKEKNTFQDLSPAELLQLGGYIQSSYITQMRKLIGLYGMLDAWYGMALANKKWSLKFPAFSTTNAPLIEASGLKHRMLRDPVGYDLVMDPNANFIFLTGANMAGKSTLIKAVGLAVYLAHLGMGVPAEHMKLSIFEGILSNINVEDNIVKGESYFFNEVKRIKQTLEKISDGKRWLVLVDELFKGTNIQDAMKCSLAVIKGLVNIPNGLFILSTHLYEIGEELRSIPSISFKYFETVLKENELHFSYQLKNGISQDRMGYLILQKEGVTHLLEKLSDRAGS